MQEQPSYYSVLTANVRYDKKLKAHEKVLFSEITALANKNGYCTATNSYFANLYDKSKTTISNWINHLKERGYLKIFIEKDGKQIISRKLYPVAEPVKEKEDTPIKEKFNRYSKKAKEGIKENFKPPIKENFKENITSNNNTSINREIKGDQKIIINWSLIVDNLLDYYFEQAQQFRVDVSKVTNHERTLLTQAVRGKPLTALYKAVDDTILREPDYPIGYLIKCIKNIDPITTRIYQNAK
ncbi:helix-turn-helix domain-containing protein [Lactobacillus hominis]|uniref:Prophage protein n=1 Tax=Lactobacillus hominis DSM 23910 = CRBIP 24.179 TaxID=1423758 RepID=I7IVT7_9LACO|nr:helix-turn-helix domain-containing protein [Lactobacillus hominis]KRM85773.1 prophage protein [Lactobacillus hominis DSM 23910 = CRBIP 24.179]MCT3347181.1 helix-turn-helix domain-containing protein [Lactobacillus hominis]CCI82013.1 Prophage protein [Lactobacillus hominis DSM 23910 = CRBIP 24.179]